RLIMTPRPIHRKTFLKKALIGSIGAALCGRSGLAAAREQMNESASVTSLGNWELIGGAGRNESWSAQAGHNRVRALVEFQGKLYAGIGTGDAQVWRFDGVRWEQVGGSSIMGSWPSQIGSVQTAPAGKVFGPPWVNVLLPD